jgi:hypothetical protein
MMDKNNDCLICMDNEEIQTMTLKNYDNMIVTCKCNGYYHKNCLKLWLQKSLSCPICRKQVYICIIIQPNYNHNNISLYAGICKSVYKFLIFTIKFLILFLFFHYILVITYHILLQV